jgi:RNase adaptor protein for sRNA GlmZ degradation
MRSREKLTLEEKVALALDLIKRERSLEEIRAYYRVSHTTAYKVRNTFLEGGRAALLSEKKEARRGNGELEERVRALEQLLQAEIVDPEARPARASRAAGNGNGASARKR